MSIRDELTKLIAQHEAPGWDTWTDENGQNHTVWTCICGWSHRQEGWDATVANQHLADAILARYSVVELPERSGDEYGHPATFQFGAIRRATVDRDGFIRPYNWMANGGYMSPLAARETAAALLAAAKFATEAADVDR